MLEGLAGWDAGEAVRTQLDTALLPFETHIETMYCLMKFSAYKYPPCTYP